MKPACNGKKFGPLLFRYTEVSLYQAHQVYFENGQFYNYFTEENAA